MPAQCDARRIRTRMVESERNQQFRASLSRWYREHARRLPWRGVQDPYRTWVSEIMLQQTRVAAVIEHYQRFVLRFPTVVSLALAEESDVLAMWSGLGYYRRARLLYRAARFLVEERGGVLPSTQAELRTMPGVGEYTSAAIASIAFGERVAVVDGNVERVLLRVTGKPEDSSAAARAQVQRLATALLPQGVKTGKENPAGDWNQAMMELGATVCLPRGPLCLQCPVYDLCRTRGEHRTLPRQAVRSRPIAYLLDVRKNGVSTEVLLEERDAEASLMAGMFELPALPEEVVEDRRPVLRVRHAITNTNYYVRVFQPEGRLDEVLRMSVPAADRVLHWVPVRRLGRYPLTGLARKILQRLRVMKVEKPVHGEATEKVVRRGRGGAGAGEA